METEVLPIPVADFPGLNPFGILRELSEIFEVRYGENYSKTEPTSTLEKQLACKLFEIHGQHMDEFFVEEEDELILPDGVTLNPEATVDDLERDDQTEESDDFAESDLETDKGSSSDPDYTPPPSKLFFSDKVSWERKKEIVALWKKNPKWSWKSLKSKNCPEVTSKSTAHRWRQEVENGISRRDMFKEINKYVCQEFKEARKCYKIIQASHLRTFAMQKWMELPEPKPEFKASNTWLKNFRKQHKIASRKITRLISKREVRSQNEILADADNFRQEFRDIAPNYRPDHVINTDQVGFQYELTSARTLAERGEKTVYGYAQSPKNLSMHSYTVQYIITLDGKIMGKVFMCLQESNGKFGPNVQREVDSYLPPNVQLTCSSSGKMSTSLNEYFIEKQLVPHISEDFLLIVDSWPGHTNLQSYLKFFGGNTGRPEITLKIIPPKTTPLCQPLDTTFHRQLKYLARKILGEFERVLNAVAVHKEDNWNTRKGVIILQSILHFQISAPIFQPMIRYAWYSSKLTSTKTTFQNVKEVCFTFDGEDSLVCIMPDCANQRFIKCAACRKPICIHHLWIENHFYTCENSHL